MASELVGILLIVPVVFAGLYVVMVRGNSRVNRHIASQPGSLAQLFGEDRFRTLQENGRRRVVAKVAEDEQRPRPGPAGRAAIYRTVAG